MREYRYAHTDNQPQQISTNQRSRHILLEEGFAGDIAGIQLGCSRVQRRSVCTSKFFLHLGIKARKMVIARGLYARFFVNPVEAMTGLSGQCWLPQ